MSMSTVFNPLSEPANPRLWVFYLSTKGNIGLRQYTPADGNVDVFFAEREESASGNIVEGSSLAAIGYRQWLRAYGITRYLRPATETKAAELEYYVSLLSPVPQSLNIRTNASRLAAITDGNLKGEGTGWLYFLREDPAEVQEWEIGGTTETPLDTNTKLLGVSAGLTYLAACYVPRTNSRYAVFQTHDTRIRVYNVSAKNGYSIDETINAKSATPLAAASYVNKNNQVVTVVYYIREKDPVLMKTYQINEASDWITTIVKGAHKPSDTTTLSVSVLTDSEKNIVTYSSDNSPNSVALGIKFFADPWN